MDVVQGNILGAILSGTPICTLNGPLVWDSCLGDSSLNDNHDKPGGVGGSSRLRRKSHHRYDAYHDPDSPAPYIPKPETLNPKDGRCGVAPRIPQGILDL